MILSDKDIEWEVEKNRLITPFKPKSLTPNGYDITAGKVETKHLDFKRLEITVLSWEVFNMPDTIGGEIFIRSTYARQGIVGTFGFVDAGYHGKLVLKFIAYGGPKDNPIKAGQTVAQIVFHSLTNPAAKAYAERSGQYQNTTELKPTIA